MFNGVREKRLLCGTIVHNTEETGSGRMQIDGGTPGNFPTREQQKKKSQTGLLEDSETPCGLRGGWKVNCRCG